MNPSASGAPTGRLGAYTLIGVTVVMVAAAFGYVGGWLAPQRLTPARLVNQLQSRQRRCVPRISAQSRQGRVRDGLFPKQRSGRGHIRRRRSSLRPSARRSSGASPFPAAIPYAPDSSVPIRSMALRFALANGQQWRTGMNDMPVFPVATPRGLLSAAAGAAARSGDRQTRSAEDGCVLRRASGDRRVPRLGEDGQALGEFRRPELLEPRRVRARRR